MGSIAGILKKYHFNLEGLLDPVTVDAPNLGAALNKISTEDNKGLTINRAICTGKAGHRAGFVEYNELKGKIVAGPGVKVKELAATTEFSFAGQVETDQKNQYND